jgi:GntR family transcriptional regulator, arabinose operon transcriptional repressor
MKTDDLGNSVDSPKPRTRLKYRQVEDFLRQQIADGHLKPGDALPPERMLAKTLGRGIHTIRHALDELSQSKIIRRVHGKGTFVNEEPPAELRQKLDVFALVLPEVSVSLYPSLIRGFIEAAAMSHHQVLVCDTRMSTHVQGDMILQLLDKNVAGVAIVPMVDPMPAYQLDILRSHGIPVVFCHRRPQGLVAPLITWPWEEVGRRAAEAIVSQGHEQVGFLAVSRYVVSNGYLKGFRGYLAERGLELRDNRIIFSTRAAIAATETPHRTLAEMLEADDRPTAVFCSDAVEAERVFLEAVRLGLRVPDDLSIVGFGCAWRDGVLSQRLTAVTIDEVDLGRRAATMVGQIVAGQQSIDGEETVLVPLGFSAGRTLGAAQGFLHVAPLAQGGRAANQTVLPHH